ncbi:MAG: hypothetical protein IKH57_21635 [Clostridia bacterium]|nr:hypothetical protein [Clostridia bacterium]
MNPQELRETLAHRLSLELNDDFALMECWKQEVRILTADLPETITFLNSCTEEEFYWVSEVFDDLIAQTQSKELFNTICSRAERIANPEFKASIATDIEFARGQFIE